MKNSKNKQKKGERKYDDKVNPNMKSHINDPYFVKKAEEAKAFLRRVGVPEGRKPLEEL